MSKMPWENARGVPPSVLCCGLPGSVAAHWDKWLLTYRKIPQDASSFSSLGQEEGKGRKGPYLHILVTCMARDERLCFSRGGNAV